ncbi:hypothetical protein CAI18_09870 [Xanthomonas citri pv. punicae]|nr:hypothetical protein BGK55_13895 [Xanthomonas citri pv. malvacearum]QCZ65090.1 hypothetical protein CAI14_11315 [Xanthomonas citri pv. punicae]QCZ68792.1 hypothetical protein CAI17_08945 [Xanthomonas citri pv. punicae]QCZ75089.1 hypothetical protein CAB38_23090 [Xanthomonas citri pv. punicae]QCZ76752.1 hypothetical protein XapA_07840 [Xanthomonas citri pv. punicae]
MRAGRPVGRPAVLAAASELSGAVERVRLMAGDAGHASDAISARTSADRRATGAFVNPIAFATNA